MVDVGRIVSEKQVLVEVEQDSRAVSSLML